MTFIRTRNRFRLLSLAVILSLLVAACGLPSIGGGNTITVTMYYGSEKQEWLEPLIEAYNQTKHKTEEGSTIVVEATPMGSIESSQKIVSEEIQPIVWSPASSIYIPVTNAEWRSREHLEDLVVGTPNDLVLSPVVIALWRPMAEALGWPERDLGWADIADLATSDEGWEAYGYPEWGAFKFGHTHPNFSNSGIVSVIAEAYAGAGKQRGLMVEDLQNAELQAFMADVESSVIHYGKSTGFFASRMFDRGPSYLSAAVMYENLVVAQQNKYLAGESSQPEVVAIYPKEGTFWSNHPYCILNAPWVTDEHRAAAEDFEAFLLDPTRQEEAIQFGFRPADPSISLTSPLDLAHGVDPAQPQTVLEIPSAEVIVGIQSLWRQVKKPVDLVVVMDVSGSMRGEKIASARTSLVQFIDLLDDRDRLEVILFSNELVTLTEMSPLGEKREDLKRRVSGIVEQGDTRLYGATQTAYDELVASADPNHIRAMVVLSDGANTILDVSLDQLLDHIGRSSEGGTSPKIFTIAFGRDADKEILKRIAEVTGGRQYDSDPENINEIYAEIATFF